MVSLEQMSNKRRKKTNLGLNWVSYIFCGKATKLPTLAKHKSNDLRLLKHVKILNVDLKSTHHQFFRATSKGRIRIHQNWTIPASQHCQS